MIHTLTLVDLLATLALAPFFFYLAMIVTASLAARPSRLGKSETGEGRSRFLVVIPAHDEESVIAQTVQSCLEVDYPRDLFSVWVIADNCTDATADEARRAGARVVSRENETLRSKGHALEYFFSQIPEGRPDAGHDAAVLVDADTSVAPDLLRQFDLALGRGMDWVQGYYSVRNPDASWRTRMMTYAFSLANGAWMLGQERMGLSVGLKGNGMCFSARGLRRFPWRAYGLVEDMEFALMLRIRGERVRFLPGARVFGEMVSRGGPGAASQRRRWEAGRRALRGKFAGPIARSGSLGLLPKVAYLLDLFFPPLVALGAGLGGPILADLGLRVLATDHARWSALELIHAAMVGALTLYAASPFFTMGLPPRYLWSLGALPYYVAWKLRVRMGRGPKAWVRTPREPGLKQS